jgi:curved DNA-binding protein CbpA
VRLLLDQSYYEILEVHSSVDPGTLQRAYLIARATYQPESTATYSIFSDEDASAILRRIEEAYSVLSDAQQRAAYDQRLGEQALSAASPPTAYEAPVSTGVPRAAGTPGLAPPLRRPMPPAVSMRITDCKPRVIEEQPEEFAMLIADASPKDTAGAGSLADGLEPEDGIFDGAVLRRIRMSLGIELDEVALRSKISLEHLHSIEEDRFGALPSPVYVRGFVKEFARCLGLDPSAVAGSYFEMMTASRGAPR